ncbi:MAG TPA: hypothetical protein VFJ17_02770 [Mycobacteriales bacterium]|jgi:hypothetical protein|nr:hypothetical protein [Mycobacteriales bacterium]
MRTPSRAALALALGVFTTTGITAVASTAANAAATHPSLARPAAASHSANVVSLTIPGTGVRMSATMNDQGDVTSTSAGDDQGDEVGVTDSSVELGDAGDAAEPVPTQDPESAQAGTSQVDNSQGDNSQGDATQSGDNQGDSTDTEDSQSGDQTETDGQDTSSSNDQSGDPSGSSDSGDSSGSGDSGSGD